MFVASATEGACSQIGVHCKSSSCVYGMIKRAGWKGNKMIRGGDTIAEIKLMSSQTSQSEVYQVILEKNHQQCAREHFLLCFLSKRVYICFLSTFMDVISSPFYF